MLYIYLVGTISTDIYKITHQSLGNRESNLKKFNSFPVLGVSVIPFWFEDKNISGYYFGLGYRSNISMLTMQNNFRSIAILSETICFVKRMNEGSYINILIS